MVTTQPIAPQSRRWSLRFSLRSLLLSVLLTGSVVFLHLNWQPWYLERHLAGPHEGDESQDIESVTLSPKGGYFVVCHTENVEVRSGEGLDLLNGHSTDPAKHPDPGWVVFSDDEKQMLVSTGEAFLQDPRAGPPSRTYARGELPPELRLSATGRYLLEFPGSGNRIGFWDPQTGTKVLTLGVPWAIVDVFEPEVYERNTKVRAQQAVAESRLDRFAGWLAAPKEGQSFDLYTDIFASPDGRWVLTVLQRRAEMGQLWDAESWVKVADWPLPAEENGFYLQASFSPDGRRLAVCRYDEGKGQGEIRDVETKAVLRTFDVTPRMPNGAVSLEHPEFRFCVDGSRLFVTDGESTLKVIDVANGECWTLPSAEWLGVTADGRKFLCEDQEPNVNGEGSAVLRDARDGATLVSFTTPFSVSRYTSPVSAIWPDGRRLALINSNSGVDIWRYRRPEYWWGIVWLPEFWLTLLFAPVLFWSLWRDRKTLSGNAQPVSTVKEDVSQV